ncbi:MAG: tetratricopeptide repeat protein, partial [Candidatus Hydrogenedentes bacterium]|nr:tetratricopeptide repeat protein [Candidatus Hydrogenedentota bacterium]
MLIPFLRKGVLPCVILPSLIVLSLSADVAAAGATVSERDYLARLVPAEAAPEAALHGEPGSETGSLPENETLTVAGDMYSLWTSQLSMLVAADESPRAWQQFMGLGPTLAQAYRQLGLTAWDGGDLLEALRMLAKAHALDAKDPEVTRKLGYVYKETGQYEKALDLLFLASIETPNDYLVWLWLGDAQRLLGKYDEAYESMLMARDLAPPEQTAELQSFVDYTGRLGDKAPSWENFETHRNFAERHLAMRRIRGFIAEYMRALDVAPAAGVTEVDALQRRAFTNQQIGIQYTFLKEHDTAVEYYQRAADLYREAGGALDSARNLNNIADAYSFLADREWLDTAGLRQRGIEYRKKALELTQQSGDAPYVRYVQGRLLGDLLEVYPPTADEVQDVRARNQRELPRSGPIPDFSLSSVADGEIAYRLADGDLAGARILIEMVLPYYEQSGYLEDSERAAGHYVNLAHIYEEQEHYQEAIRQAERALEVLDSMRGMMVPDAFNRSGVLDTYRHASTMLVRASLLMDKPAEALGYFEQYEYQSRHDMLAAALAGPDAFSEYSTERVLVEKRLPVLQEELDSARSNSDAGRVAYLEGQIAADTERLEWLKRDIDFFDEQSPKVTLPEARATQDILDAWPDNITLARYLMEAYGAVVLVVADKAVQGFVLPEADEAALNELADAVVKAIAEGGDASGPLASV